MEAQSYQPINQNSPHSTQEGVQDELLFRLLSMKVLEMGEELKKTNPEKYYKDGMEAFMETVRRVLGE